MKISLRAIVNSLCFATAMFLLLPICELNAQPVRQPPPDNIKIADQPDSPLQITINQMMVDPKYGLSLSYAVRNAGSKGIIGFVVDGMPGSAPQPIVLETPLLPGAARSFPFYLYPQKELSGEFLARIDFVLSEDGKAWGANSTGEADFVIGLFEGLKRVISDSKKLVELMDDARLQEFISKAPDFPELSKVEKGTKKYQGLLRGYGAGLISFRESLKGRGDVKGIPGRITDLEKVLGITTTAADMTKRISMNESLLQLPIKILGISIGKDVISLDENFHAPDDWLKDLKLKIANTSGKTIKRVSFSLLFPETRANGNAMAYTFSYGPLGLPGTIVINENEKPIPPDAVFELNLDEGKFESLKKFVGKNQQLSTLTRLHIEFDYVYYDDKTGWNGTPIKQDPQDPRRWISDKP